MNRIRVGSVFSKDFIRDSLNVVPECDIAKIKKIILYVRVFMKSPSTNVNNA
jgi:hypothetical protein